MARKPLTTLAILRASKGWTQRDLARLVSVNVWTLSKVEGGSEKPSVRVGRELERLFKVDLKRLLSPAVSQ
jgi:ribosome-binding protein aMBF1 (putative translation factor)